MVNLITAVGSMSLAFGAEYLAGKFSAMQDAVKHFPNQSIFHKEELIGTTKKIWKYDTKILYEYWYNLNSKDHLSKYEDYDNTKPKRKFKIFKWNIHIIQICDAWHWYKMWTIAFYNLSDILASFSTMFSFIYLYKSLSIDLVSIIWYIVLALVIYYWANGYIWNASFNSYYNKKLRKGV